MSKKKKKFMEEEKKGIDPDLEAQLDESRRRAMYVVQ